MKVGDPAPRTDRPRSAAKRELILDAAMRHFAERGYREARVEDIAVELGIAKGSIFQHFGSKAGLFLATYKRAVTSLPAWLDAPTDVVDRGFWDVLEYWLRKTEHLAGEDRIQNRVAIIGNYGTDLGLKREINRFLVSEDPYGTLDFVEYGQARGEVRTDVDAEMLASMLDWVAERFQDALVSVELDPGLFHRHANRSERRDMRIDQLTELLWSAIGPRSADRTRRRAPGG